MVSIRAVTVVAFVVAACNSVPEPVAPTGAIDAGPVAVASASAAPAPAARELNSPCQVDAECASVAGATCTSGGALGPKKGGLCRLLCEGASDPRCAAPNACMSAGKIKGVERFSCERTCDTDADCHVDGRVCMAVFGPKQPAFCIAMMTAK